MTRKVLVAVCAVFFAACSVVYSGEVEPEIPANAPVVPWTKFSIQYTVRSINGTGPRSVEFYITSDMGKTWTRYGEDPDSKSPMTISVSGDGVYGFMTVGTDSVGNRERPPVSGSRPESVIIVDRTAPSGKWISPAKSGLLKPDGIELAWEASDKHLSRSPVTLEYSTDNQKTWLPLKDRLPASGKYSWQPPQGIGGAISFRMIVRDRAGNRLSLKCKSKIVTDAVPPTIGITGPQASPEMTTDITYAASDDKDGTGISRVTLYYSNDNGDTWNIYGDDDDLKSPMSFTSELSGRIGLFMVAHDNAGNSSPRPVAGTQPPFYIHIDNEAPQVSFDPQLPNGEQNHRGGKKVKLRWSATDMNIQDDSAKLEFSKDGGKTWELIKDGLPVNGPYTWTIPDVAKSLDCYLRISVSDTLGNEGSAKSLRFGVFTAPPETDITNVTAIPEKHSGSVSKTDEQENANDPDGSPKPDGIQRAIPSAVTKITENEVLDFGVHESGIPLPPIMPEETDPLAGQNEADHATAKPVATDSIEIPERPEEDNGSQTAVPVSKDDGSKWEDSTEMPVNEPPVAKVNGAKVIEETEIPQMPEEMKEPLAGRDIEIVKEAESLFRNARTAQAQAKCQEALHVNPRSAPAYDLMARLQYARGDFARAAAYASKAVKYDANESAHWYNLGEASYSRARQLKDITADSSKASIDEMESLQKERDTYNESAIESFRKFTQLAPDRKKGHARLGDCLYMKARILNDNDPENSAKCFREAIDSYKRGYAIGETTYRETFQLGVCYYRLHWLAGDDNTLAEAQRYLERSIEEAPADVQPKEAYWYLAGISQKMGRKTEAMNYWQKVISIYPDNSPLQAEAKRRLKLLQDEE